MRKRARAAARRATGTAVRRGVALALAGGLAGCGLFRDESAPPAPCPEARVLAGAARTSAYLSGRQDPEALRHVAALRDLASACRYTAEGVEVDLAFAIVAERGPVAAPGPVELDYFVATVGPGGAILSKQLFTTRLDFPPGEDVAGVEEGLTLRLPPATPADAAQTWLYLGFQLDEVPRPEPSPLVR